MFKLCAGVTVSLLNSTLALAGTWNVLAGRPARGWSFIGASWAVLLTDVTLCRRWWL